MLEQSLKEELENQQKSFLKKNGISKLWEMSSWKYEDETKSYVLVGPKKKARRVRNLTCRMNDFSRDRLGLMWFGWLSRLERVHALRNKAYDSIQSFKRELEQPFLELIWNSYPKKKEGRREQVYLVYCRDKETYFDDFTITKGYSLTGEECEGYSYSYGSGSRVDMANEFERVGWDAARDLAHVIKLGREKWLRFYFVQEMLEKMIDLKLRAYLKANPTLENNHVVEFFLNEEKFRYVLEKDHRTNYGIWKRTWNNQPQVINIGEVLPESNF